jgi:uncharacterized membrane protein
MEAIFKKIGSWLFLLGVIIAILVGLVVGADLYADTDAYIAALLAVLGFVVGILSFFAIGNISEEKVPTFLIAALILVMIGAASNTWTFGTWTGIQPYLYNIANYLFVFAAPAAGLLAIRAIWDAGKTEEIDIPKKVIPK